MNFMEEQFGYQLTDEVVDAAAIPDDAAFTTIGRYPSEYATRLITAAADCTNVSATELCRAFGRYLFTRFEIRFPHMIQCYPSARSLLCHVEAHIHEEVRALYPDAKPPSVTTLEVDGAMHVIYQSDRPFAQIAFGLVDQCIVSYGEHSTVEWCEDNSDSHARFVIRSIERTAA
ncbi:heme NO binding domain-containing protein [Salinisphaera sp. T5B8]